MEEIVIARHPDWDDEVWAEVRRAVEFVVSEFFVG